MDCGSGMLILAEPEMQQFAEERRILEREEVKAGWVRCSAKCW